MYDGHNANKLERDGSVSFTAMDHRRSTVITVTLKAEHGSVYTEGKPESVHFFDLSFLLSERKLGLCLGCEIP